MISFKRFKSFPTQNTPPATQKINTKTPFPPIFTVRGVKMRKTVALFIVLLLVLLVFAVGCAKDESSRKLASRPVKAQPTGEPAEAESEPEEVAAEEPAVEETRSVVQAGQADCEQLSSSEISSVLGGDWSKTGDCPQRPAMPKGVDVCQCSYDGPKQIYVNVETQLYDDSAEAERVYKMYCEGAEAAGVNENSCVSLRTTSTRPNYVYFLKDIYFVKVSCLGGSCPVAAVEELAKQVEAEI
jgi:hypothetical protein